MIVVLVICGVYLVSVMGMYTWVKTAYSEGGYLSNCTLNNSHVWMTFIPLANTLASLVGWIGFYPLDKEQRELNLERFFQIKKEDDESKN
jgi:hypothetical protein